MRGRAGLSERERGLRGCIAVSILAETGFEVYNFAGGFRFYDAVMNDRCLIESATACGWTNYDIPKTERKIQHENRGYL